MLTCDVQLSEKSVNQKSPNFQNFLIISKLEIASYHWIYLIANNEKL